MMKNVGDPRTRSVNALLLLLIAHVGVPLSVALTVLASG